jgi:hypothetical protein
VVFRGDPSSGSFLAGYYAGDSLRAAASLGKDRDPELIRLGQALEAGRSVSADQFADPGYELASPAEPGGAAGPAGRP